MDMLSKEFCVERTRQAIDSEAFDAAHIANMKFGCALRRELDLLSREAVEHRAAAVEMIAYERRQKPHPNLIFM